MVNIFKSYNPYSVILLFIIAIITKFGAILHAKMPFQSSEQIVWNQIGNQLIGVIGSKPFVFTLLGILCIVCQALFLNLIANRSHIFPKNTYLPAFTYVLLTSFNIDWNYLSAPLIANWFVLGMLNELLKLYLDPKPQKKLVNAGIFVSIAALLVFPNIIFVLFLFIGLLIIRNFKLSEWMVTLVGLMMPFYFLAGYLFLNDKLPLFPNLVKLKMIKLNFTEVNLPNQVSLIVTLCLLVFSFVRLNIQMKRMLFQVKKMWWVIILLFVFSILNACFTRAFSYNQWIVTLLPSTLIISQLWFLDKKRWLPSVFLLVFLGTIFYVQWIL